MRLVLASAVVLVLAACSSSGDARPAGPLATQPGNIATPCREVFKPGVITKAEWATGLIPCGGNVVVSVWSGCPEGRLVRNDFGHGYVGKPWSAAQVGGMCTGP